MGPGDDGHFVDADLILELLDAGGDLRAGADKGVAAKTLDAALVVGFQRLGGGIGCVQRHQDSAVAIHARQRA